MFSIIIMVGSVFMKDRVVRLASVSLTNFKNVLNGSVSFSSYSEGKNTYAGSDIIGVYGQNGSGKTALIDALHFLQLIMQGSSLQDTRINDYINLKNNEANIKAVFNIFYNDIRFEITYVVTLANKNGSAALISEELYLNRNNGDKRLPKVLLIKYDINDADVIFKPKKILALFSSKSQNFLSELKVARMMGEKDKSSFIFGSMFSDILIKLENDTIQEINFIVKSLQFFSQRDLFVINNNHSGMISANLLLPMAFRIDYNDGGIKGDFPVLLDRPFVMPLAIKHLLDEIVEQINMVLIAIIPGMKIGIKDYGRQLLDNGEEGVRLELISCRKDSMPIPIRMESSGIIKIISILQAMIKAFANPSICLAIDELDAGIFEYILGEILSIFANHAKGQLLFTSHNLRPLEVLDKKFIVFSTANPERRYIRFSGLKATNNLRDSYIRAVTLGGQKEILYDETDNLMISKAFRKAGRLSEHE